MDYPEHYQFFLRGCICAKLLQLCPTLYDPMNCSPPGSSVHVILQARIPEQVPMPSSRGSSRPRDRNHICFSFLCWQAGSLPLAPTGKPPFLCNMHQRTPCSHIILISIDHCQVEIFCILNRIMIVLSQLVKTMLQYIPY